MTTETATHPSTLEEAQIIVAEIAAAERLKNLYEFDVLTEADDALASLAASVRATLEPLAARLLSPSDIGRLNGAIYAIETAAITSSQRKAQLSMLLNPPAPLTMPIPTPPMS